MDLPVSSILAIAGVALIVCGIVGGGIEIKEVKVPRLSTWTRVASALGGVALLAGSFYGGAETRIDQAPRASFEVPAPNSEIGRKSEIRGSVSPATAKTGRYWIVARDDDGDYYPQSELTPSPDGLWAHFLSLGPAWQGRPMQVVVALATERGHESLRRSIDGGLPALPDGVTVLAVLNLSVAH